MEGFIEMNEFSFSDDVDLSDSCPSHDILERVVSLANPDCLKELKVQFEQSLTSLDAVSKFISVEGESIRGYCSKTRHSIHNCHRLR